MVLVKKLWMAKSPLKKLSNNKTVNNLGCIKIIAEIVVNMNFVVRIKLSSKLKNSTSEIGYYSYTNLCMQFAYDENIGD